MERLRSVTERYGSVAEALQSVAGCYGTLWSVAGRYGSLPNVTENIDFAHHLLNFKFCSSLKCECGLSGHAGTKSEPDAKY